MGKIAVGVKGRSEKKLKTFSSIKVSTMKNSVNDVRGAHCCENLTTEESLKLNFFMTISQSNGILFAFSVCASTSSCSVKNLLSSCLLSIESRRGNLKLLLREVWG